MVDWDEKVDGLARLELGFGSGQTGRESRQAASSDEALSEKGCWDTRSTGGIQSAGSAPAGLYGVLILSDEPPESGSCTE